MSAKIPEGGEGGFHLLTHGLLRRLLTNVKDKNKPEDRQGEVYKIK